MPNVIVCVIMCIGYLGVWVGLTLWMNRIKRKASEFGRAYKMDQLTVFLILSLWPITAIPWFLWRLVKCTLREIVDEEPTIDAVPVVRGKWKDFEVTYVADKTTLPFECIYSMRCNQCNRYYTGIYYYGNPAEMTHFCPNCGADMREEIDHD